MNFSVAGFEGDFGFIAKLPCAFTETCDHFQVEKVDGLVGHDFLVFFCRKTNIVRNPTCFTHQLIYNVVTDCTVLKTDHVHHARVWNGVVFSQLTKDCLRLLQVRLFLGLSKADVRKSISNHHSNLNKKLHLVQVMFEIFSHPDRKGQRRGQSRLSFCLGFGHVGNKFLTDFGYRLDRYLFGIGLT